MRLTQRPERLLSLPGYPAQQPQPPHQHPGATGKWGERKMFIFLSPIFLSSSGPGGRGSVAARPFPVPKSAHALIGEATGPH